MIYAAKFVMPCRPFTGQDGRSHLQSPERERRIPVAHAPGSDRGVTHLARSFRCLSRKPPLECLSAAAMPRPFSFPLGSLSSLGQNRKREAAPWLVSI